jgi:hypothetical protein
MAMATREITVDEILRGMDEGVVRLIVDPNMDEGTVAEIGASWFYFGGADAEDMDPDEYEATIPREDVARMVYEALREFEGEQEYSDEWAYYRAVIDENG